MLIASGEAKLFRLQSQFDAHILNVCTLRFENSFAKVIGLVLVEQGFVQRKFDLQLCFVKNFKDLSEIGEDEHNRLWAKQVSSEDACYFTSMKFHTWKQHKVALSV
jgi:hypothetical protein